jgi:iron complex outermembrane receptor protein
MGERDLSWTLGGDLERTDYALRTAFGPQTTDQEIRALYGNVTVPVTGRWTASLGVRGARATDAIQNGGTRLRLEDRVTVGSAALRYEPTPGWTWLARWDQSFRFPTVDEHTNVVTGQPAGLATQTGDSFELGVRLGHSRWEAGLVLYRLDLDDEISFDSSTFFNLNLEATRRTGAILELDWGPVDPWRIGASYTYVDGEITAGPFAGNRIPLVPRHSGRLYLAFGPAGGVDWLAEAVLTGERVLGGDFENRFEALGGHAVLNLVAGYTAGSWRFNVRVNNLLDRRYSDTGAVGFDEDFILRDAFFPAPERSLWITARCRFGQ